MKILSTCCNADREQCRLITIIKEPNYWQFSSLIYFSSHRNSLPKQFFSRQFLRKIESWIPRWPEYYGVREVITFSYFYYIFFLLIPLFQHRYDSSLAELSPLYLYFKYYYEALVFLMFTSCYIIRLLEAFLSIYPHSRMQFSKSCFWKFPEIFYSRRSDW